MASDNLREALEKLADEWDAYTYTHDNPQPSAGIVRYGDGFEDARTTGGAILRQLLRAHPAPSLAGQRQRVAEVLTEHETYRDTSGSEEDDRTRCYGCDWEGSPFGRTPGIGHIADAVLAALSSPKEGGTDGN